MRERLESGVGRAAVRFPITLPLVESAWAAKLGLWWRAGHVPVWAKPHTPDQTGEHN
jgi:hypothetical protein